LIFPSGLVEIPKSGDGIASLDVEQFMMAYNALTQINRGLKDQRGGMYVLILLDDDVPLYRPTAPLFGMLDSLHRWARAISVPMRVSDPIVERTLTRVFGKWWGAVLSTALVFVSLILVVATNALGFGEKLAAVFSRAYPEASQAAKQAEPKVIGTDNTFAGNVQYSVIGSGNTIVRTTDGQGNSIMDLGGIAIGRDACADSTSIAIGAGANAGACAKR
jgi:hypothetical protein